MSEFSYYIRQLLNKANLALLSGICYDPTKDIFYIVDMKKCCVQEFFVSDEIPRPLSCSIKYGETFLTLKRPLAIAWDSHWGLIITDVDYRDVFTWNATAECWEPILEWIGGRQLFSLPGSISGDGMGNIYVSDFLRNEIWRINGNGEMENVVVKLEDGTSFSKPYGIFCLDDQLFITDSGGNRIIRHEVSSGNSFTVKFAGAGIRCPIAIAVDRNGTMFVCEQRRILCYDAAGKGVFEINTMRWKAMMQRLTVNTRLVYAGAIAIKDERNLVLVDTIKGKVYQIVYERTNV